MNPLNLPRIALLACAFGVASITAASAQATDDTASTNNPSPSGYHHHPGGGVLTKDEWQELKKDREQVLSSNPDLQAEGKALHDQMMAYQQKVDAAVEQADPNAAALIAKLKAAHHDHHDKADSDSNTDTSNDSGN